jgi:hypothetical protein
LSDSTFTWATVTALGPLRIRVDGDSAALVLTPESLVAALLVGSRVRVEISDRRILIHGLAGGEVRASIADVTAGTDPVKIVTPAVLAGVSWRPQRGTVASSWTSGGVTVTLAAGGTVTALPPERNFNLYPGDEVVVQQVQAGVWVILQSFSADAVGPINPIYVTLPSHASIYSWDPVNWQLLYPYSMGNDPLFSGPWRVTRNSSGVVTFTGLAGVSSIIAAGVTIATLPVGFRPGVKMRFTINAGGARQAVDINTDGTIVTVSSLAANIYVSLSSVIYHEATAAAALTWNTPALLNSFVNDSNYGSVQYAIDTYGDVWVRGVVTRATAWTDNLAIFALPAGFRPTKEMHFNGYTDAGFGYAGANAGGTANNVHAKLGASGSTRLSLSQVLIQPTALDASMFLLGQTPSGILNWQNGWLNYDAANYSPAGFRRRADGLVLARGLIRTGSGIIYTLPPGYRPAATSILIDRMANGAYARLDVSGSTGGINYAAGSNAWASMDGMAWQAAL